MLIAGKKGIILLSGCNSGYGGEGPNGTRKILVELGIEPEKARHLMHNDTIEFVAPKCTFYNICLDISGVNDLGNDECLGISGNYKLCDMYKELQEEETT